MEKLGLPEMRILRLSLVAESLIYHFVNADKNRLLVFLLRFGNGYLGFDTFDGRIECRFWEGGFDCICTDRSIYNSDLKVQKLVDKEYLNMLSAKVQTKKKV